MQNRRAFLRTSIGSVVLVSSTLSGCLGSGPVKNTNNVSLTADGFDPKNVHVDEKSNVIWTNTSDKARTVASASDNWDFELTLDPDQGGRRQFYVPDVYVAEEKTTGSRMKIGVGSEEIEDPLE